MSLQYFNDKLLVNAHGMLNTGSICYFNSFIQSLLSCSSVSEFFLTNSNRLVNPLAREYINIINTMRNDNSNSIYNTAPLHKAFIDQVRIKYPEKKFGTGQEDTGECMHLFLDIINEPVLNNIFTHMSLCTIWCNICRKTINEKSDESFLFEIPALLDSKIGIEDYVKQSGAKISDYKCIDCKKNECVRIYQLSKISEVFIIMFNKFKSKSTINFPNTMVFNSKTGPITYSVVSTIEHIGQKYGHYTANCLRKGKLFYLLNDSNVSPGRSTPVPNTYVVFYHLVKP